jgi:hypothetical protein
MFAPREKEENSYELLTQWEQELDMLEDIEISGGRAQWL